MSWKPSLAARAALAVGLTVGFYVLALAIAGALLSLPVIEMRTIGRLHIQIALGCVLGAVGILWAILPRRVRFVPPGPELRRAEQPRLFALIDDLARQTGQRPPQAVYLAPDVNAFVAQHGGFLGLGSRRVMGLGLPLLSVLSEQQLRAVLAHEFGHYHGGDTELGPWIHRTRGAIGRTVHGLRQRGLLQVPFRLYARGFLRITQAVSRQQELAADALAARLAGGKALADGLRKVHGHAPAWAAYWASSYAPALNAGLRVPLVAGYEQFVEVPSIRGALSVTTLIAERSAKADPYDTHPPLGQRLAELERLPPGPAAAGAARALDLLEQPAALEERLIAHLVRQGVELRSATWNDVAERVVLPACQRMVAANAASFEGLTPRGLPELFADFDRWCARLAAPGAAGNGDARTRGERLLASALLVALRREGYALRLAPGREPVAEHQGREFAPWAAIACLHERPPQADGYRAMCDAGGVPEVDLGEVARAVAH